MKIAGYIHPIAQALGPNFACGWFEIVAKLLQALHRDADCECMMIAGSWPFRWAAENGRASLLEGVRSAEVDEIALYRTLSALGGLPTALDQAAYDRGHEDGPALQAITDEVARSAGGFEPDVIISFGIQIDFLSALWPNALRLHVESGPFSRNPYPFSMFFDHLGMYGRSIVGQAGDRLRARPATGDLLGVANAFRTCNALALDAVDPFHAVNLRAKFDAPGSAPLASLELLFVQRANQLSDAVRISVGCLIGLSTRRRRDRDRVCGMGPHFKDMWFGRKRRLPAAQFSPADFSGGVSLLLFALPVCMPRVDGVWSVSSNVAYQALLYNRTLGSPPTSHFGRIADATTLQSFFGSLDPSSPDRNDALMAWLLERYFVPEALLSDGRWLRDYFARRIGALAEGAELGRCVRSCRGR